MQEFDQQIAATRAVAQEFPDLRQRDVIQRPSLGSAIPWPTFVQGHIASPDRTRPARSKTIPAPDHIVRYPRPSGSEAGCKIDNSKKLTELAVPRRSRNHRESLGHQRVCPEIRSRHQSRLRRAEVLPEVLPKIRRLRQLCRERGLEPATAVDGEQTCASAG